MRVRLSCVRLSCETVAVAVCDMRGNKSKHEGHLDFRRAQHCGAAQHLGGRQCATRQPPGLTEISLIHLHDTMYQQRQCEGECIQREWRFRVSEWASPIRQRDGTVIPWMNKRRGLRGRATEAYGPFVAEYVPLDPPQAGNSQAPGQRALSGRGRCLPCKTAGW